MLGHLREQLGGGKKRPAVSLPSGRKSSKFARLAFTPALPAPHGSPTRGAPSTELAARGDDGCESARRAPACVAPIAPFVHLRDVVRRGDDEGERALVLLPEGVACRPFAFATDEEVSASCWLPVISPRPRAAAYSTCALPHESAELCARLFALVERHLGEFAWQFEARQPQIASVWCDEPELRVRAEPRVQPQLLLHRPLGVSLKEVRADLAADANIGMAAAGAQSRSLRTCAPPSSLSSLAFSPLATDRSDGGGGRACGTAACGAADASGSFAAAFYELEPTTAIAPLSRSFAEGGTSAFVDLSPLAAPRQLPAAGRGALPFAFCELDAAMRGARARELAGAQGIGQAAVPGCTRECDAAAPAAEQRAELCRLPWRAHLPTAAALGQFAARRLAHTSFELASLDDAQSTLGELMPQTGAPPLDLRELLPACTALPCAQPVDLPNGAPRGCLSSAAALGDARRAVDVWMVDSLYDAGDERLRTLPPPDLGQLDLRTMYELSRKQRLLRSARAPRLARSDTALLSARQRLLGFAPSERPVVVPSTPGVTSGTAWLTRAALLHSAGLAPSPVCGRAAAAAGRAEREELDKLDVAVAPCATADELTPALSVHAGSDPALSSALPAHAHSSPDAPSPVVHDGAASEVRLRLLTGAGLHLPASLRADPSRNELQFVATVGSEPAAIAPSKERNLDSCGALSFQPERAQTSGGAEAPLARAAAPLCGHLAQDDLIDNFMRLRQRQVPPLAPSDLTGEAAAAAVAANAAGAAGAAEEAGDARGMRYDAERESAQAAALVGHVQPPAARACGVPSAPPGAASGPAVRLQLCVGERARRAHSPLLVGLATRGIRWCDRAFWSPCFALSANAAAIALGSADLLDEGGEGDVLEELHVLSATFTRCWLVVDSAPGLDGEERAPPADVLLHRLSRVVIAARSLGLHAIPALHASSDQRCDVFARIVTLECECAMAAGDALGAPLPQHESAAENLLSAFLSPLAAMRVLADARLARGTELASFLALGAQERRELFPWLHPAGSAALDALASRTCVRDASSADRARAQQGGAPLLPRAEAEMPPLRSGAARATRSCEFGCP